MKLRSVGCPACLVALAACWVYQAGFQLSDFDPRSPWWLRSVIISKSWTAEKALCAEGARCVLDESQLWSPDNKSSDDLGTLYAYFGEISPVFNGSAAATLVALHRRFLRRSPLFGAASARSCVILQIGSNIPKPEEVFFIHGCNEACGGNARWVLVEPQAPLIERIKGAAWNAGLGPERTTVVNAAVCPSAGADLELWQLKSGTVRDPRWANEITGFSTLGGRDRLIDTWRRNVVWYDFPQEDRHVDDLESWIESVPVKCHTPTTLLKDIHLAAADVDFIFVDAEGYDAEILSLFMELPDFSPAVIMFEYGFHHASRGKMHVLLDVVNYWSRRGYAIHKDADNMIMFRTDGS